MAPGTPSGQLMPLASSNPPRVPKVDPKTGNKVIIPAGGPPFTKETNTCKRCPLFFCSEDPGCYVYDKCDAPAGASANSKKIGRALRVLVEKEPTRKDVKKIDFKLLFARRILLRRARKRGSSPPRGRTNRSPRAQLVTWRQMKTLTSSSSSSTTVTSCQCLKPSLQQVWLMPLVPTRRLRPKSSLTSPLPARSIRHRTFRPRALLKLSRQTQPSAP